jgi:spermidine/putrescine transport system substrate-binding protein
VLSKNLKRRKIMKRIIKLTVFLVLVSLVLFVVGSQVIAASSSNVLRLITWSGYAPEELIAKFKEETGIEVQVILSNNEEMISKLRATRGGGFDLAQPSQDRISSVVAEYGIYQPIDYSKVNLDQLDPSLVEAVRKNTLVDGKSYGVPHVYGTSGLIVNFEKAPDVKDYKDLL